MLWENATNPFGLEAGSRGEMESEVLFTGKIFDPDADFYYFNARWYDADTGRFASEDAARDGINWYAYVGNNPLKWTDPMGLKKTKEERQADRAYKRQRRANDISKKASGYAERARNAKTEIGRRFWTKQSEGRSSRANYWSGQASRHSSSNPDVRAAIAHANMDSDLIRNGAIEHKISNLVNIDNLSKILSNPDYRNYFDNGIKDWMNKYSNQNQLLGAVRRRIRGVRVFEGANRAIINGHLESLGSKLTMSDRSDAMGVGSSIYVRKTGLASMNVENAALLGHEAIHGIQSLAAGGLTNFENAYVAAGIPTDGMSVKDQARVYYGNTYERAAYGFGPKENDRGFGQSYAKLHGESGPVLVNPIHNGWWH